MTNEASTHPQVPVGSHERPCLGPDGSAGHVIRVFRMLQGRWKLPILFRLYAAATMRSSQLLRDMEGISQKMLTPHLRKLGGDGLVDRTTFAVVPPHVEYSLSERGRRLIPLLIEARCFSMENPKARPDNSTNT